MSKRIESLEQMRSLVIDIWCLSQKVLELNITKCWGNLEIAKQELLKLTQELNQLKLSKETRFKREIESLTDYISELVEENQEAVYKVEYFSNLVAKAVLLIHTIQYYIVIERL